VNQLVRLQDDLGTKRMKHVNMDGKFHMYVVHSLSKSNIEEYHTLKYFVEGPKVVESEKGSGPSNLGGMHNGPCNLVDKESVPIKKYKP